MLFSDEDIVELLEQVFLKYQLDVREYNMLHLRRRIEHCMNILGFDDFAVFQQEILSDDSLFFTFLRSLSIQVTEMFREPLFFLQLQKNIFPSMSQLNDIRIWVAGCASGEETYSLAILLHENNLLDKSHIIATDFNEDALEKARLGEYAASKFDLFNSNYQQAGGRGSLNSYFQQKGNRLKIDPILSRRVVLAKQNLVSDRYFSGVDLLFCRNVLIYFSSTLQHRVVSRFTQSLNTGAYLCLGMQEEIFPDSSSRKLVLIDRDAKIYQKQSI